MSTTASEVSAATIGSSANSTDHIVRVPSRVSSANRKDLLQKPAILKDITQHFTTVVHAAILGFIGYVFYLCFHENITWTLTTWHAFLFSIAWFLFMTEGILVLTTDNIYTKHLSHLLRVRFHWIIQSFAVALALAGFLCMHISKNQRGHQHVTSAHAIWGFVALVFCAPTCLNGVAALFNVELKRWIGPRWNKLVHAVSGIVTLLVGGVAMVLSLYTGWFREKTGGSLGAFYIGWVVLVVGFVWCVVRPVVNAGVRVKMMLR